MYDTAYTHCITVRCLKPDEMGDDERNEFMRHFDAFMQGVYATNEYEYQELTEEKDDSGIYFTFTIWTKVPLDEEDEKIILTWAEVLNAHLNIGQDGIEIYP